MHDSRTWSDQPTYTARFEDGPRSSTVAFVLALDTGQPPELLLTPDRTDGVYVLAGGQRADGSLPYMWMPRTRVAALQRLGTRPPTDRAASRT
jgi:hypothetical protein